MNLSWLEDFLALAATGNFSRAAEERHMTQPAFSRRIRALEEWLGAELFDRSMQPARLTAAGEWFRPQAEELLARVARVPGEARAFAEANASTLRIAATHALSFTFVPRGCNRWKPTPAWAPSASSRTCCNGASLAGAAEVQFVIAHGCRRPAGNSMRPACLRSPSAATCCCGAGAGRAAPGAARIQRRTGLGRIVRQVLGPELATAGWQPVFTAHLASVLKSMALDARGLAWLPETLVREELQGAAPAGERTRALAHPRRDPAVPRPGAAGGRMPRPSEAAGRLAGQWEPASTHARG
jgi:DNA-binding transcriptional LysR family regulator